MPTESRNQNVLNAEGTALKQAMRGDPAGFRSVYEMYKNYVFSLCVRMTCNRALSEDLTQDVFFRVWKKISSYHGDSKFRTWLHRVTVNTVLMHFRQRKRRIHTVTLEDSILPEAERESAMTGHPLEDQVSVRNSLSRLSPAHRRILTLHEIEGYCHEDISHILSISPGASKSQLHKARLRLSTALGAPRWSKRNERADARDIA